MVLTSTSKHGVHVICT